MTTDTGITNFCTACGGHVAYDDSSLCAACLITDLYRKLDSVLLALKSIRDARAYVVGARTDDYTEGYQDGFDDALAEARDDARRALEMIGEEQAE